jgi:hypothetical protein
MHSSSPRSERIANQTASPYCSQKIQRVKSFIINRFTPIQLPHRPAHRKTCTHGTSLHFVPGKEQTMKKILSGLSVATLLAATVLAAPPARAYQGEPWAAPPSDWQGARSQGFHDGIEGARKDAENHRPPNVDNRDEYRHPSVPHHDRAAYREGFRRGYEVGVQHLMQNGRY